MSKKPDQIHETVVRDIIDLYDTIRNDTDIDEIRKKTGKKSFKSIASASSNLTAVFPVLCTRGLDISNAAMVTKAIERKCTSMLQMLFSAIPVSDAGDAFEFLSNFHTNLNTRFATVDDAIDIVNNFVGEMSTMDQLKMEKIFNEAVARDMRNLDYVLPDNISESSINQFKIMNTIRGRSIIKEDLNDDKFFYQMEKDRIDREYRNQRDRIEDQRRANMFAYQQHQDELNAARQDAKFGLDKAKANAEILQKSMDVSKMQQDMLRNQIIDSDVKKANELMPTMMTVNFKAVNKDINDIVDIEHAVIGVKAKMYPVDTEDVCNRILSKTHDKNVITNFIRATTREISFWKDFIFAIDRAKIDALSYSRKGSSSKIWKVLERRALKSKIRRLIGGKNDASAITTLVISQDEVEYMKKTTNIDIENLSIARGMMESYNLMGLVIVDENVEVAKFLFDTGDDMWENVSFTHLERESSDNTYKRVVNLMTKMR